jgi:hypothetical protein
MYTSLELIVQRPKQCALLAAVCRMYATFSRDRAAMEASPAVQRYNVVLDCVSVLLPVYGRLNGGSKLYEQVY